MSTSSKVEFVRSFFGRNVGLKKSFRICLTFKKVYYFKGLTSDVHLRVVHFTLSAHDLGDNRSVVVYQSIYFHASSLIDEGVVHVIIETRNRQKKIVKKMSKITRKSPKLKQEHRVYFHASSLIDEGVVHTG